MEYNDAGLPPGWTPIAAEAARILRQRDATAGTLRAAATGGRLQLSADGANDYAHGVFAGAAAVSAERCARCGGKGDPLQGPSADGAGTACAACRRPGEEPAARPWPPADTADHPNRVSPGQWTADIRTPEAGWSASDWRNYGRVENLYADNLALLMAATDDQKAMRMWSNSPGWAGLLRALLLTLRGEQDERPGDPGHRPWRLRWMKAKFGYMDVRTTERTPYQAGAGDLIGSLSMTTCQTCGRPGRNRNEQYVRTECDRCHIDRPHRLEREHDDAVLSLYGAEALAARKRAGHTDPSEWAAFERLRRVDEEDTAGRVDPLPPPLHGNGNSAAETLELGWHGGGAWKEHGHELLELAPGGVLAGGAVLGARWGHRYSADVDFVVPRTAALGALTANGGLETAARLEGTAQSASPTRLRVRYDKSELDIVAGGTGRIETAPAEVDGLRIETMSTAQILAGKLARADRLLARDAADIAWAAAADPDALRRAAAAVGNAAVRRAGEAWRTSNEALSTAAVTQMFPTAGKLRTLVRQLGHTAADALESTAS